MQSQYKDNDLISITLRHEGRAIGSIHFQYGDRPTKEKFADMVRGVVKSDSLASIQPCECRFAYMRSGTCRMLKFSTNADVPFLIYAVISWLRLFNEKLKSKH